MEYGKHSNLFPLTRRGEVTAQWRSSVSHLLIISFRWALPHQPFQGTKKAPGTTEPQKNGIMTVLELEEIFEIIVFYFLMLWMVKLWTRGWVKLLTSGCFCRRRSTEEGGEGGREGEELSWKPWSHLLFTHTWLPEEEWIHSPRVSFFLAHRQDS